MDLLHNRHILPAKAVPAPKPKLHAELWNNVNCSPDIFRSTLTKIPETESILKKSRLPLGILIHPFKDLSHLPVIQCQTIVRYDMLRQKLSEVLYLMNHFVFADVGSAAPTSILSYNSSIRGAGDATFVTGSTTVSTRIEERILFFSIIQPMIDVYPVPEEFLYDPVSKSYGDPSRRPECKVTIQ